MAEKDYYKILEVPSDAGDEVIKKSFRKLAKKYHPDTNGGNVQAAQKFQEINEAYSVLSDEKKRKEYDAARNGKQNQTASSQGTKGRKTTQTGFNSNNFRMDFGDMMFEELNKEKKEKPKGNEQINFADVSSQFASFFGFKPK